MPISKVLTKAGLDNVASALCKHQHISSAMTCNFHFQHVTTTLVFLNGHFTPDWTCNEFTAFANTRTLSTSTGHLVVPTGQISNMILSYFKKTYEKFFKKEQ
jgi:hypothetical protein